MLSLIWGRAFQTKGPVSAKAQRQTHASCDSVTAKQPREVKEGESGRGGTNYGAAHT